MGQGLSSLALNPRASIAIDDHEQPPSFLVEAPIKGASMSSTRVGADNLPGAHAFLCSILIDGDKDAQVDEQDAAELRQIGLFAPANEIPQPVDYRFPLRDSAVAGTALPRTSIDGPGGQTTHLGALRLPAEWEPEALHFEPHHHASVWSPVRLAVDSPPERRGGATRPHPMPRVMLDSDATRAQFDRDGFATLENLLPAEHVRELGRYFQELAAQGYLHRHDDRGTLRHVAHNHPVARFWHDQLNERVAQLAGQPTKPSYSFVSLYIAGGNLAWHTDRPPCEYTITLLLDYAPLDADGRSSWALKVTDRQGTVHLHHQRIGEGLILKGRELVHGRDVLPDGHRSASLLFHFVNADYDGVMR